MSGGYATSSNFSLLGSISQMAIGASSATAYKVNAGFLYFPFVSTPIMSATAGSEQVIVNWTVPETALGWRVGGYSVGYGTSSGGPYTYTDTGDVQSTTITSLTNSTPYYFIVNVLDGFGNSIATSSEISSTPVAASSGGDDESSGGGGGGGGGAGNDEEEETAGASSVTFSGRAYPESRVILLKDGQIAVTTVAGADAKFSIQLTEISTGNYLFSIYGEDKIGNRSNPLTFPIRVATAANVVVGGVFLAPTIDVDKSQVKKGDTISIFGQTIPEGEVVLSVNSEQEHFVTVPSDADGAYLLNFDTSVLEMGEHHTKSKASILNEISPYGEIVAFSVGSTNILKGLFQSEMKGDLNGDRRINLVDFSIAAYWYKKPELNNAMQIKEAAVLNNDQKIDLVDFSIMAYYWTG